MSEKMGKRDGYYAGYNHGIKQHAYASKPELHATMTGKAYLEAYLAAYDQGYDQAKSDRGLLLSRKEASHNRENDAPERLA